MFSFISIWKLGHALSLMSSCNCRWSCSIVVYLSWSVLVRASKLTEWVSAAWKKIVEASFRSQESNDCGERQAVLIWGAEGSKESSWAQSLQEQPGQVLDANAVQMDLRMLILSLCSVAEMGICEAGDGKGMGNQV